MLSILIPTYNYDATDLINALNIQLKSLDIIFEIRCYDDGSNGISNKKNSHINNIKNNYFYVE